MNNKLSSLVLVLSLVVAFAFTAMGQETTGNIEVTVRDAAGAVVPNATVTIESSRTQRSNTAGFRRNATTDSEGFVRVLQVPPGTYRVTVGATSGFAEQSVDSIDVVLGKNTPVTVDLRAGGATATVDVTGDSESPIDTTDTKVQTSISQKDAELLPKGTNFASLLKVSPATRPEPLSGGFQIDGASGSENTYIVDGNERTNAFSGELDQNNNLPFQLIQEFNVRSSGFEAEYGGATGGVISVVTRGGSNDWRGEFGMQLRAPKLQAQARPTLNLTGTTVRQPFFDRDTNLGFFPTATLGGPIVKDRVWFFTSYTPQIFDRNRTIVYRDANFTPNSSGTGQYSSKQVNEYAFGRVDAQPFDSLRLTGSFTYNPIRVRGELPGIATTFDPLPNGSANVGLAQDYQNRLGGRQNANATTGQATWAASSNLVLSLRGGHNFLNSKLGTYGRPVPTSLTRIVCSASSINIPTNAGCAAGGANGIATFDATSFDATKRDTIDADATFLTNFLGRHEFKGGYQLNRLSNEVLSERVNSVTIRYGRTINQLSGRGNITPSAALCVDPNNPTPGCVLGAGVLQRIGTQGAVSSKNEGFFIQDRYQPINRLTFNLGIRAERENVPSFNPVNPDLVFNFGSKIAPRIGVSFDLTGDGKTKLAAFFGRFYDRFKYELPRGSFGGDLFYQDYFEVRQGDPAAFSFPIGTIVGSGVVNTVLGSCPSTGFVYGRIRCSINARVPSNAGLPVDIAGGIDPDIKPYRQTEMTALFERELTSKLVFSARFSHKNLDRTIEDIGFFNNEGSEVYIIGNPGEGAGATQRVNQGLRPDRAVRRYDAFEFRLDRRFADDYYFNANYTYSRLYGNYSGLASSDEAAILAGTGRTDPNVSRYFDAPFTESTVAGGDTMGRLPTDRPHVFKIAAAYSLDWGRRFGWTSNTTEFQTFFTAQSGTPQTTIASIAGYNTIIVNGRGDLGRTAKFISADFAMRHRYQFGRDKRFTLVSEVDVLNLLNRNSVVANYNIRAIDNFALDDPANGLITQTEIDNFVTQAIAQNGGNVLVGTTIGEARAVVLAERRFQQNGAPGILSQINSPAQLDQRFGQPLQFQAPREVRFGFRLLF
jgi:hypothetical protein